MNSSIPYLGQVVLIYALIYLIVRVIFGESAKTAKMNAICAVAAFLIPLAYNAAFDSDGGSGPQKYSPPPTEWTSSTHGKDYQELVNNVRVYENSKEYKKTKFSSSIVIPEENEMLDNPLTRYVRGAHPNSSNGGGFLLRAPGKDKIVQVYSSTCVTVYCVRGSLTKPEGKAFIGTEDGQYGWITCVDSYQNPMLVEQVDW